MSCSALASCWPSSGAVAVVACRSRGRDARRWTRTGPPARLPDDRDGPAEDVKALRLGVALRGYRMDEVDDVLDVLAAELVERDEDRRA